MNLKTQELNGKCNQKEDVREAPRRLGGSPRLRVHAHPLSDCPLPLISAFFGSILVALLGFVEDTAYRDAFGMGHELTYHCRYPYSCKSYPHCQSGNRIPIAFFGSILVALLGFAEETAFRDTFGMGHELIYPYGAV